MKKFAKFLIILVVIAAVLLIFSSLQPIPDRAIDAGNSGGAADALEEQQALEQQRAELLAQADGLADGYFYEEALSLLKQAAEPVADTQISAKIAEIEAAQAALVPYSGSIYHVFLHSLIADTARAFDGDSSSNGYNLYMTTVAEFQAMLPQLQERGFVLIDLAKLATRDEAGQVTLNPLLLPAGKKPLIISFDDVSYYQYMAGDGFANRLTVDDKGRVATVMRAADGAETVTYDGDGMPILDSYVAAHPEFSYRGAKGTLALTGYEGVFGYRITDLQGEQLTQAIAEATKVAEALKASGWSFASHSYTHNQYFKTYKITMEQLKYDTERWQKYIQPVLGATNIFISPFGMTFPHDDSRYQYLVEQGFYVYCSVGSTLATTNYGDSILQPRVALDGYMLQNKAAFLDKHFFNTAEVLDINRP